MEFRNELYSSDVVNLYGGSPNELQQSQVSLNSNNEDLDQTAHSEDYYDDYG